MFQLCFSHRAQELKEAAAAQGSGAGGWLSSSAWRGLLPASWLDGSGGSSKAAAPASMSPEDEVPGTITAESAGWVAKPVGQGKQKVAVVHAVGAIVQGPVQPGPRSPNQQVHTCVVCVAAWLCALCACLVRACCSLHLSGAGMLSITHTQGYTAHSTSMCGRAQLCLIVITGVRQALYYALGRFHADHSMCICYQ